MITCFETRPVIATDVSLEMKTETRPALLQLHQIHAACCVLVFAAPNCTLCKFRVIRFYQKIVLLQENASVFYELLSSIPGLTPIRPSGAMYLMVRIELDKFPDFSSDVQFTEVLMSEESVFCLPATVSQLHIDGSFL